MNNVVKFRKDLAKVSVKHAHKCKVLKLEQFKRKKRKLVLDEEGDYVAPNRPKHVYKEAKYGAFRTTVVRRLLQKAASLGWLWDDLYKIASATITKPKYASMRALFKKPSHSEYSQHNHTTNSWHARASSSGKVVMNEPWKTKKYKNATLPLYAKNNTVVASRGNYELRSVRQKIKCGCLESPYKDSCTHGNKWPVKYVWFKVTRAMVPYTGYVKRDGTPGYELYFSRVGGPGYVVDKPMLVETHKHHASKKEIAKLAPITQEEIYSFIRRSYNAYS